ncbi:MAG: hypothetical protein L0287_21365 [Anaerolineae bacterium]|nr:hypothetical protein [Anaerolineae bacterium]MCI0610315.1 hypothetical protein [Anaerolineae bacterium]
MKKFYTEKDIEDLFKSGVQSLRVNDDVALTDLAYEKAKRLGLQLLFDDVDLPPIAPIRPYLSNGSSSTSTPITAKPKPFDQTQGKVDSVAPAMTQSALTPALSHASRERGNAIAQRIRFAVLARLGNQVDAKLLDSIIQRVVKATGVE